MTTDQPTETAATIAATLQEATRRMTEAFAEMGFQLATQGALGQLLRGEPETQTHNRLTRLTTHQLERTDRATRTLLTLVNGILEDRETQEESTPDTEPPKPPSGRPEPSRDGGEVVR